MNLSKSDYKKSGHLRFLQINTFYQKYLIEFYKKESTLATKPADEQIQIILDDGFSAIHNFCPVIRQLRYDSRFIIANCLPAQIQWLKEKGLQLESQQNWLFEITKKQIEDFKPDILFLSNAFLFDSKFIRQLAFKPKLVFGWTGEPVPQGLDWSDFDVILSNFSFSRSKALEYGARATEHFYPGFLDWLSNRCEAQKPSYDVVFAGQWSDLHRQRNRIIYELALEASRNKGFTLGLYLLGEKEKLPPEVQACCLGERFGLAMHAALRSGKIAINAGILPEAGNMRLFETTGTGVFLLTEYHKNITDYFVPGKEIETYKNHKELIDKIYYYLQNPEKRETIAECGKKRCLQDHSMEKRIVELDGIIQKHIRLKYPAKHSKINSTIEIKMKAEKLIEKGDYLTAFQLIVKAKSLKTPTHGLDYLRAVCFLKINQTDAARESLREELRYFPSNTEAKKLLDDLLEVYPHMTSGRSGDAEFQELLKKIRPYTMLSEERLFSLFSLAKQVCQEDIPGNFVECGVAAGGSSGLLSAVIKRYSNQPRRLFAFDSFEGMPAPTKQDNQFDGKDAAETGWGTGTCAASEHSVREICENLGTLDILRPIEGYFDETLPRMKDEIGKIAFLHMDGDWYESTNAILHNLYDKIIKQGIIQVDDYGHWAGCKKAFHEFENSRNLKFDINKIDYSGIWFRKPQNLSLFAGVDDNNIKIAHVCMQDFGGAGKAAYRLHKGLQTIGVDSTMLVLNKRSGDSTVKIFPNDYLKSMATCFDVPIYDSPVWNQQNGRWHKLMSEYPERPAGLEIFTDAVSDVRLDRVSEIREADIINLHWVAGAVDWPSAPLGIGDKPIIWTLHDMNPFTGGCHYAGDCKKYMKGCGACPQLGSDAHDDLSHKVWKQKCKAYQDLNINVVTPSRWLGKCASESELFSRFPVHVIPYGFPVDTFRPHPKAEIHKALKIPDSVKIILFGAHSVLNERKGFRYLLEALNKIPLKNGHDIAILTFGSLPKGIKIPSKYSVVNLGSIADEKQLAMAYSVADVFVLPSLEDNLPNTVIEAMACGVPVVGFDIGGMPDMIEHKKTGYLVKPKDIKGLIEGIDWIISSADSGRDFLKECRAKAEKEFSLVVQANAYRDIYERIRAGVRSQKSEVRNWKSEVRGRKSELQVERVIESPEKLYQTAQRFMIPGRAKVAIGALKVFLALYPNYALAHNDLGVLYHKDGDKEKTLSHYEQAVELAPDNTVFQKNLADFYYVILGQVEDALEHYAKAFSSNPADIHTLLMLGHISVSKKRFDEATVFYNEVLKIEPLNRDAKEKLSQLASIQREKDGRPRSDDSSVEHQMRPSFRLRRGTEYGVTK